MNNISKLRSKVYNKIIQVNIPITFYWNDDDYDGYEFYVGECTSYERRLLRDVFDELEFIHGCALIAEYMRDNHNEEWKKIMDMIDAESAGVPQEFIDAFKDDDKGK